MEEGVVNMGLPCNQQAGISLIWPPVNSLKWLIRLGYSQKMVEIIGYLAILPTGKSLILAI